jgi:6-phosphogluconolactonase (cycloisomerase 2 family)
MNSKEEAMNKKMLVTVFTAVILMLSTVAVFANGWEDRDFAGAVYTMTNASANNEVVMFNRDDEGLLTKAGSISTGGLGSGGGLDPLGSQGSLVLSADHRWLLAVNAGSNEISVFRVLSKGLKLVDKVSSGGTFPVSLTINHNLVYVLNAGTAPNITGFHLSHRGQLIPLEDSTRSLVSGGVAQVGFDPEGELLVVTDRANNKILVYTVGPKGLPAMNSVVSASNGLVPFGLIFDKKGHLLVAEAGSRAVSSYKILSDGTLKVISPSVANGQAATCWIAGNKRGDVFTANTGSRTISDYDLMTKNGELALRNATAGIANRPIDLGITSNGRFLYALDPGNGTVHMFHILHDGSLNDLGAVDGGLSIFAQGIAAH